MFKLNPPINNNVKIPAFGITPNKAENRNYKPLKSLVFKGIPSNKTPLIPFKNNIVGDVFVKSPEKDTPDEVEKGNYGFLSWLLEGVKVGDMLEDMPSYFYW